MRFQQIFYIAAGLSVAFCHTLFVQLAAEGRTNGKLTVFAHHKTQKIF